MQTVHEYHIQLPELSCSGNRAVYLLVKSVSNTRTVSSSIRQ